MLLGACLNEVLDESLETEDDILKALDILDVTDERAHLTLALGELYLTVLIPELVAAHHGVYILYLLLGALEQLTGQFVEGIVVDAGVTNHRQLLKEAGHLYLGEHIVDTEHPTAIGQLCELLYHLHVLNPVDIALLRDGHLAALYLPTGVGQDIQVATETEVLLVVWQEVKLEAQVLIDIESILDIIAVEANGIFSDRRREGILQHADLIVVDVHIGEHLLHHRVKDVASLYQVVDTLGVDTFDDGLLIVRFLTVDLLRHRLVDTDGQDKLVVIRTGLDLVDEPLFLLVLR